MKFITSQPTSTNPLAATRFYEVNQVEKQYGEQGPRRCHQARTQRILAAALLLLLSIGLFALAALALDSYASSGLGDDGAAGWIIGLVKRQSDGNNSGNNNTFVNNKLYLIVVFVGLFLVLIMGICLSAWCCRESFENPCCCPCYLCACCGGLACLDCIACGLCVDAAEQL